MKARVRTAGTSLAATLTGREGAPSIVLSNSLGATAGMWEGQLPLLEKHFRVLTYDTRGHGESDTPQGPYSFDDLVSDVTALMDHFAIDRAHFMGLSLGGMTGLGLALSHPDRIDRLIVCDARADAPGPFVKSWDDRMAILAEKGIAALWPGTLERWLTPETQAREPAVVERLRAAFVKTTGAGYGGCAAALKRLDYLKDLGQLSMPVQYVVGAEDMGAPPAAMKAMAEATPGADYVEIEGAAHIANIDKPATFNEAVARFLGVS